MGPKIILGDFGQVQETDANGSAKHCYNQAGTPPFRAPELVKCRGQGTHSDIFSCATVLSVIMGNRAYKPENLLFMTEEDANPNKDYQEDFWGNRSLTERKIHENITNLKYHKLPQNLNIECRHLIHFMLCGNPQNRPTAKCAVCEASLTKF